MGLNHFENIDAYSSLRVIAVPPEKKTDLLKQTYFIQSGCKHLFSSINQHNPPPLATTPRFSRFCSLVFTLGSNGWVSQVAEVSKCFFRGSALFVNHPLMSPILFESTTRKKEEKTTQKGGSSPCFCRGVLPQTLVDFGDGLNELPYQPI